MNSTAYTDYSHPRRHKPYRFIECNYAAITGHLASCVAMITVYLFTGFNAVIPYTETLQRWQPVEQGGVCPLGGRSFRTGNGDFCIFSTTQPVGCNDDGRCYGVDLGWLVISFHMLSGLFQAFAAVTNKVGPVLGYRYSTMVANSTNPLRFIEYGISAGMMLIAIALLNGVTDINLIVSIGVLTSACQLCGLVVEYTQDLVLKWVLHLTGWLQFGWAYGIIFRAFFSSISHSVDGAGPPHFVYVIVIVLFLLYASFGFVQLVELICLSRSSGTLDPYLKEVMYVGLSLTAKLFLGWMIFANVLVFGNGA